MNRADNRWSMMSLTWGLLLWLGLLVAAAGLMLLSKETSANAYLYCCYLVSVLGSGLAAFVMVVLAVMSFFKDKHPIPRLSALALVINLPHVILACRGLFVVGEALGGV
jgi:hypothetical protein